MIHDIVSEKRIFIQTLSATTSPVIDQGEIKLIKILCGLCARKPQMFYVSLFSMFG